MADDTTTIKELKNLVSQFIQERDWRQFHGAKNMSINIAIEAAELMELFVWHNTKEEIESTVNNKRESVEHELADILFSILAFADEYNIDLSNAFHNKMLHNSKKYPVTQVKGHNKKYTEY